MATYLVPGEPNALEQLLFPFQEALVFSPSLGRECNIHNAVRPSFVVWIFCKPVLVHTYTVTCGWVN